MGNKKLNDGPYYYKPSIDDDNGEAIKVWEILSSRKPYLTPRSLFFSVDHIDGSRWVMDFREDFNSWYEYGGGSIFEEIERDQLNK